MLSFRCAAQFPGIEMMKGQKELHVPFEYTQGFIIIDVFLNGYLPLKFIFDTGAENTLILKKEITDLLGIPYSKKISIVGSDMSTVIYAYISRNVGLRISNSGSFRQDILILEEDLNNLNEITGMNIDGIVGANLFKNLVLEIDFRKGKLIFHNPASYKGPKKGFNELTLSIKRNKPYLTCETALPNGKIVNVDLLLDTGASLNYLLHENTHPDIELPKYIIPGVIGTGIGGNLKGYLGKVGYLEIGEIKFEGLTTSFQNLDESILEENQYNRNGIIGNRLLDRFTVIINYPMEKLYLKPRRWLINKPFDYDKSGLVIYAIGRNFDKYYVKEVIPGTPGDRAGIKPGDYVLKFNLLNTKFYSLQHITGTLSRKPGRKIRMTILRDGMTLKKEFFLEDFLEKNLDELQIPNKP